MVILNPKPTSINQLLSEKLDQGLRNHLFTGGSIGLFYDQGKSIIVSHGLTSIDNGKPIDKLTVFDLASLTKVVATLPSILVSIQSGKLSLIDNVTDFIPELGEDKKDITIFHLLTHTSGLPAWRPYFINHNGRDAYIQAIANEPLVGRPGEQVIYSDLGFMLLGFVLERIWDETLDKVADELIFKPLDMKFTNYTPLNSTGNAVPSFAATELGNEFEYKMVIDYLAQQEAKQNPDGSLKISKKQIQSLNWRKGHIIGTVHDCNAFYGLNGVSGHAGLFSTIEDIKKYMEIWLEDSGFINKQLKKMAFSNQTGWLSPRRGLGWEVSANDGSIEQKVKGCTGGDLISNSGFGHTGFTGTSIWRDPERGVTLCILTNRVHPKVSDLTKWRRQVHNQVFAYVDSVNE